VPVPDTDIKVFTRLARAVREGLRLRIVYQGMYRGEETEREIDPYHLAAVNGGFCVYAYYKFVRYEEAPPQPRSHDTVTEIPSGLLPERPKTATPSDDDPALREYNAYLAELANRDKEHKTP